jgi:creatinine amidohydrolase
MSDGMNGDPVLVERLAWPDVRALTEHGMRMCIVPVGATEQHGPHLPVNVDTLAATYLSHEVSRRTGVPVLPTLAYGCSLGHTATWPGTFSLLPRTLASVAEEVLHWAIASGFTKIAFFNHHATNFAPLRVALEMIRHRQPGVKVWIQNFWEISPRVASAYGEDGADVHANVAETSMLLAIAPELVRMDRVVDEPDRSEGRLFSYTVAEMSVSGVVGRPSAATREKGLALIEMIVEDLSGKVMTALKEEPPDLAQERTRPA